MILKLYTFLESFMGDLLFIFIFVEAIVPPILAIVVIKMIYDMWKNRNKEKEKN